MFLWLVVLIALLIVVSRYCVLLKVVPHFLHGSRLLLVTAHPDDECMFFAPFIIEATKQNKTIHLLCLSNGLDGNMRSEELKKAAELLKIKHLSIYGGPDSPCLPGIPAFNDGHNERWDEDQIASVIDYYVRQWSIDTIVTFDQKGVSLHLNHKQAYRGVRQHKYRFREEINYLVLKSLPPVLKYLSWLGVFLEVMWSLSKKSTITTSSNDTGSSRRSSLPLLSRNSISSGNITTTATTTTTTTTATTTTTGTDTIHTTGSSLSRRTSSGKINTTSPDTTKNSSKPIIIINTDRALAWKAMEKHKSQLVWFRKLYLMTSTYVYLNVLVPLTEQSGNKKSPL